VNTQTTLVMKKKEIQRSIRRLANEIIENNGELSTLVIIGIRTRGEYIGRRIVEEIRKIEEINVPFGIMDITFYRDDVLGKLNKISEHPVVKGTDIMFDITKRTVVLVDDVLYTGRSVRAALDCLTDLGRPKRVQLAVLIDRGHRELPIQADFVGKVVQTKEQNEYVSVKLAEVDGVDKVELISGKK